LPPRRRASHAPRGQSLTGSNCLPTLFSESSRLILCAAQPWHEYQKPALALRRATAAGLIFFQRRDTRRAFRAALSCGALMRPASEPF
jgi:hypothetical protein